MGEFFYLSAVCFILALFSYLIDRGDRRKSKPPATDTLTDAERGVMRKMGQRGGKIGGKNRMAALSPEQRTALGKKAAEARWAKRKKG